MTKGITVERRFHVRRGRGNRRKLNSGEVNSATSDRVPRVSRLMALAIRFEQLIHDGVVADQAELARLGHVSRARLTQIMNLLNLAPVIQEDVLNLESMLRGPNAVSERHLRSIAKAPNWRKQLTLYRQTIASKRIR